MGLRIFCARQLCLKAFGTGPVPDTPWLPRPPEHPPPKRCVPPWPPGGLPVATLGSDFSLMLGICDLSGLTGPLVASHLCTGEGLCRDPRVSFTHSTLICLAPALPPALGPHRMGGTWHTAPGL